jgi:hypothetical protein
MKQQSKRTTKYKFQAFFWVSLMLFLSFLSACEKPDDDGGGGIQPEYGVSPSVYIK